jgi:hypothetical protein
VYRFISRYGLSSTESYFIDNKTALNGYVRDILSGKIAKLPNDSYPGDLIPVPDGILRRWIFSRNGFVVIQDISLVPDDSINYLIYCPNGVNGFDLEKATLHKKAFETKGLDDHWVYVIWTYSLMKWDGAAEKLSNPR